MNKPLACTHHWDIQPPAGPQSLGVCRRCKEERLFSNASEKDFGTWAHSSRGGQVTAAARRKESGPQE